MIRVLLFAAVLAVGADAVVNDGAYTKAAWAQVSAWIDRLQAEVRPR